MIEVSKRLINRDEYYKMAEVGILKPDDHVELIHGEIIEMSPIGSRHAAVVDRLIELFQSINNGRFQIRSQSPIDLGPLSEPEPDIGILKKAPDHYANAHPTAKDVLLVVEVSDTTLRFDKETKQNVYASSGIAEYWLVDLKSNALVVHRNPHNNLYRDIATLSVHETIDFLDDRVEVKNILI